LWSAAGGSLLGLGVAAMHRQPALSAVCAALVCLLLPRRLPAVLEQAATGAVGRELGAFRSQASIREALAALSVGHKHAATVLLYKRGFAGVALQAMVRAWSGPACGLLLLRTSGLRWCSHIYTRALGEKKDGVRGCTDVAALVGLLAPGGSDAALEEAVSALAYLCSESTENKESVRECGGAAAFGLLAPGGADAVREGEGCMRVRGEGQDNHLNNQLLPSQPGTLRRQVWRKWPEQGSAGLQAVQHAHDSAVAWASKPDK